jgi:hypothetical protein
MPTREQVFSALFAITARVQWDIGVPGTPALRSFITRTRRIKLFSDVTNKQQPWIGQAEHSETYTKNTTLPYRRVFKAQWMVYHQDGKQPSSEPTILNNLIIDAIENAMAPLPSDPGFLDERNTLSGLVHHCYIDGEVFKDPGDIDNQALIIVPITILVP